MAQWIGRRNAVMERGRMEERMRRRTKMRLWKGTGGKDIKQRTNQERKLCGGGGEEWETHVILMREWIL
jgi:hypothetical protein